MLHQVCLNILARSSKNGWCIPVVLCRRLLTSGSEQNNERTQEKSEEQPKDIPLDDLGDRASSTKSDILRSALQYVPEHGWSKKALALGAEAEGLPPVAHGMFPSGGIELVTFFYLDCNSQLRTEMEQELRAVEDGQKEKKKVSIFVKDAVVSRLSMLTPYTKTWPQAMGMMSLPQNVGQSLQNLTTLVDDIWYYAGDRSVDMNWYTKRVSLAAAYKSTELFLVQDSSPGNQETWQFLDRRLANLATVGKSIRQTEDVCTGLGTFLSGAFTTTRNLLGMNDRHRGETSV